MTIENVPVGKVTFCVLANEAALGKDYDTEEFELVDVPDRTSKKALLEDPDRTYFPKRFSEVNIGKGAAHELDCTRLRGKSRLPDQVLPGNLSKHN